ncbi:MAG: bifunctional ADP-dependent NAD(P)H-hydrate dehydratase/NAD(P)H-hydrate epimerase, partial [Candidatus Melainabacteria bacterium HGW-Melainabacteria-1]
HRQRVKVWLLGEDARRSPENLRQLEICRRLAIELAPIPAQGFDAQLAPATVIVDALFGVGLSREISGPWAEAIETANAHPAFKVAVDIPSGIHSDTGAILGLALKADLTVTYAYPKWGHLLDPALDHIGRLEIVDIGIPPHYASDLPERLITPALVRGWLPGPRPRAVHKGGMGRLGIVAGAMGMSGAARMAAEAALQTGPGLVFLFVPASIQDQLAVALPEVQVVPLPEVAGQLGPAALEILCRRLADMDALLIGPGLGRNPSVSELLAALLPRLELPLVLDADALYHLAEQPRPFRHPVILTPHPGELARLLHCRGAEIQADRVPAAREAAAALNAVTLLKGARSLVATPDGEIYFNPSGNPGMARGGMGDVLAGLVAGLLAQGLAPAPAAGLACYWHGHAGDRVVAHLPEAALTVQRLLAALPEAWASLASHS